MPEPSSIWAKCIFSNSLLRFSGPANYFNGTEHMFLVNPNKSGIGGKPPTFVQNNLTP